MKLCHILLRLLQPRAEKERREFRKDMARAEAHAEEFSRTVSVHADQLTEVACRKVQLP